MSITQASFPDVTVMPASRGLRWCVDGLRLWRRAPFKLFFLCLVETIVAGAIENIPWVGSWTFHIFAVGMSLAPYLILLEGRSPWHAFTGSARIVLRHGAPFVVFLLVEVAIMFATSSTLWLIPLSLVFVPPWLTACTCAIWHDLGCGRRKHGRFASACGQARARRHPDRLDFHGRVLDRHPGIAAGGRAVAAAVTLGT